MKKIYCLLVRLGTLNCVSAICVLSYSYVKQKMFFLLSKPSRRIFQYL